MIGPECGLTTPGAIKCVVFFLFFFFYPQDPVHQRPCPAVDLPNSRYNSRGRRKATTNIQVVSIMSIKSVLYTIPQPTPGGGHVKQSHPLLTAPFVSSCTYSSFYLNKAMQHIFASNCISFLYICSFMTCCIRTFWYGQIHQGLMFPASWCDKSEHFHKCGTPNL